MLLDSLKDRILILDGAMGTMLQRYGLQEDDFRGDVFAGHSRELKGNNECLNLTRPDLLLEIHRQYIAAGADIISTNSFSANAISQEEYGCADFAPRMAREAAAIARRAADEAGRKVWVAGSVGPTGKSLSLAPDISDPSARPYGFEEMSAAYKAQIEALVEGGADIILLETCFDALNTKAALWALESLGNPLPVMVSVSVSDRSGRTLTGQTIEAFYHSVRHAGLLSFGLNCSLGAEELGSMLRDLSTLADCRLSCHPNAGLPDEMGRYTDTPEHMAASMAEMARAGLLNIAGGCCGTTPEHIRAIGEALRGISPRPLPARDETLCVSGLESHRIVSGSPFLVNVGERTNVAGSRKFARLISEGNYDQALQIAADQIDGGAGIIDINMDDAMLVPTLEMRRFLRHISNDPAVARAALMIDSSHWETLLEGLRNAQGKCIVNSISLKDGEQTFLEKARALKAFGAAVVVMAFDEQGQATTYERKIEICARAYDLLVHKAGFAPTDIIFDVNVLSVGTGLAEHRRYGIDFIEAVRWIKTNLPGALTSGGISNLSFAFRGNNPVREAMHSVFLYHAKAAGLDMGIVNPSMLQVYDSIEPDLLEKVEDVVLDRRDDATERLIAKAQEILASSIPGAAASSAAQASDLQDLSPEQRLVAALVKGRSAGIEADLMACLEHVGGRAVDVIEGPLMDGMKTVGEYFGAGKMFLPQVVKSAKVMHDAVEILRPYMDADAAGGSSSAPKVVIATVKGDVHDIGKNITSIVMSCNGFEVIDLGVMVPPDVILDKAMETGADIVAVSGLITPSLYQMEEICREMTRRGMTQPLFVGGATTSAVHTAVKLAPLYEHVFHGSDASASAVLCKRVISDRASFEEQEHARQAELRRLHEMAAAGRREAVQAAPQRQHYAADSYLRGRVFSDIPLCSIDVDEVMSFFDWRMFFTVWGVRYDEALKKDALALIDRIRTNGHFDIRLGLKFREACCEGDDIVLDDGRRLPMMRQEYGERRSLADFVPPCEYGFHGPVGFFSASVRTTCKAGCSCGCGGSDYDSMLLRSVRVTMVEAVSSWVDDVLARELGDSRFRIVKPAAGYYSCPDHTIKRDILDLIPDSDRLGISFTETYAMIPDASICALVFAHPEAGYPEIRQLSADAIGDYAARRGFSEQQARLYLSHLR